MLRCFFIYGLFLLLLGSCKDDPDSGLDLDSFELEEGFKIELVASEPLISDPVDMEIDEFGRFFIVEMHGYPLDLSGTGKIIQLTDSNGDGAPDQRTVFLEGLVFPTGILRWKQGFLITDPPNVLYIEDTDNDGRADVKDTVLTGFARSNPQHNVNNPSYGLDNWIYLSHEGAVTSQLYQSTLGDRGSEVHFAGSKDSPALPQNASGLSVRFKPDAKELEMLSIKCQFGQTFDAWGHHFQTNNATHLHHAVLASAYMQRNIDLLISSGQQYIPIHGRGFDIFPITTNPSHQLLTDIGAMTSACGILWYQGGLFPQHYDQVVFTAEPVHNLIHTDIIQEKGATFQSVSMLSGREFLASEDAWFRPVNQYVGPDGALYILDYHRKIIEHPEWLSQEVINSGDLYLGKDKGRIYRISPVGTPPLDYVDQLNLYELDLDQLISKLTSKNSWWRINAQRLLMDRADATMISKLQEFLLSTNSSVGKVHGLWLLEDKGGMKQAILEALLRDGSPGVRENAIKVVESYLTTFPKLEDVLIEMANDSSPKVRYQLLLTLGQSTSLSSSDARLKILIQDIEDNWVHYAALSARKLDLLKIYSVVAELFYEKQTDGARTFFKKLGETIARNDQGKALNQFLTKLLTEKKKPWFTAVMLDGITAELQRNSNFSISDRNTEILAETFLSDYNDMLRTKSIRLLHTTGYFTDANNPLMGKALSVLEKQNITEALLADAILVVGWTDAKSHIGELQSRLTDQTMPGVRSAVLEVLNDAPSDIATSGLIRVWPDLFPEDRNKAIAIFLKNDSSRLILLQAISKGQIMTTSLSWPQTVSLLNSANKEVRQLARIELKGNELDADAVWEKYEGSLALEGEIEKGADVFQRTCAACHQINGEGGISFGPDLAAIRNRNKSSMLLDILQPNKSIADGYELCILESNSGIHYSGVVKDLSPNSLTLKEPSGSELILDRSEIKSLKFSEISAMPENLYADLNLQQMADLLAYLKNQ